MKGRIELDKRSSGMVVGKYCFEVNGFANSKLGHNRVATYTPVARAIFDLFYI